MYRLLSYPVLNSELDTVHVRPPEEVLVTDSRAEAYEQAPRHVHLMSDGKSANILDVECDGNLEARYYGQPDTSGKLQLRALLDHVIVARQDVKCTRDVAASIERTATTKAYVWFEVPVDWDDETVRKVVRHFAEDFVDDFEEMNEYEVHLDPNDLTGVARGGVIHELSEGWLLEAKKSSLWATS